jgi:4-carboxymuconolactone decarboxylase
MAPHAPRRIVDGMGENVLFDDSMRGLVRIAAAIAGAPLAQTRRVMHEAVGVASHSGVDEVLLQSYLFCGFPRTLNAARAWREVSGETAPEDDVATTPEDATSVRAKGEMTCETVYGAKYDALRQSVRALHPALDAWMVADGYGKVLSRPGLTLAQRELCIVAACAASEQIPQLKSHLRGALNCGATHDDLAQALSALTDIVPREALGAAREELNRIKES